MDPFGCTSFRQDFKRNSLIKNDLKINIMMFDVKQLELILSVILLKKIVEKCASYTVYHNYGLITFLKNINNIC